MKAINPDFSLLLRIGMAFMLTIFCIPVSATHIVGAELYYECTNVSSNTYDVTIRFLRDCDDGEAEFDDPIQLFAFSEAVPGSYLIFELDLPLQTPEIVPPQWDQCVGTPYNLCVEEAIYRRTITLPPQNGGWLLAWARCCRNAAIDNLDTPLDQGVTFLARVPSPTEATCNNMPSFDNQMPTFICAGENFTFDHSATDLDGDSLVYEITHPYDGLNFAGFGAGNASFGSPQPVVGPNNPMGPPPYRLVTHSSPFGPQDPFGPNTTTIDPQTGLLQINAPNPGVYVIAISVFEYRDGVLLSENKKDLQVHVINCLPQNDPPLISHDLTGLATDGDTILIQASDDFCYTVNIVDTNMNDLAFTPISAIFSGGGSPTINVTQDVPGQLDLDICWQPDCDFNGAKIELVLMGIDESNCPIYNPAFDTVYVRILPPLPVIPAVDFDLSAVPSIGDTVIAVLDSSFCFDWWVVDTMGFGDSLTYSYVIENLNGSAGFQPISVTAQSFPDSIGISVCWQASCNNLEQYYRMIIRGDDASACPPANFDLDTIYFYIPPIPNPPPVVTSDLSGNVLNNDTIQIDVHGTACYTVVVDDTFPSVNLEYAAQLIDLSGQTAGGQQPVVTLQSSTDSLVLRVCWSPNCDNVDATWGIVLTGTQENECQLEADNRDTVYVHVNNVINPPPIIGHNFLPGFQVDGDTISIPADSLACFEFFLRDTVIASFLSVDVEAELISDGSSLNGPLELTLTTTLDTLIEGTVCFSPGCEYLDELFLIRITGRDTFDCYETSWVYDSVYVRLVEPDNNPPTIQHFLGNLPVIGGEVVVEPNTEPYCYRVELNDPDPQYADLTAEGFNEIFGEFWRYGNFATVDISGTNPLIIDVCWAPSCYDSEQSFDIVVCGRDTSRCALTEEVCDTVVFTILPCSLEVQNVFSPNDDGINDVFEPYSQQGVDFYLFQIFDRWGALVHESKDGIWDGTWKGKGKLVPDGVYYYIIEYKFVSARGIPLKEREVGHVTVIR